METFSSTTRAQDADIRAELLYHLLRKTMPVESAIAIASLKLSLYWSNGIHREARRFYDLARIEVTRYANCFGYNVPEVLEKTF